MKRYHRYAGAVALALVTAGVPPFSSTAAAQQGTIAGQVTDATTLQPLSGAQVYIPGTQAGTLTNAQGAFTLVNVPAGALTVHVQRLGYRSTQSSVTVEPGAMTRLNFELRQEALQLDEVVVTGTAGQARRREVGTSIAQIDMSQVRDPVANVDNLLASRAPGVNVLRGSGMAGGGAQIRLRGNVSVTMSNQPLIYIDGVRMRGDGLPKNRAVGEHDSFGGNEAIGPLNMLNPADIERVEVVKGPAATALYGTEAAGGVIQIFTKRGQAGAPIWTAQVDQGVDWMQPFGPANEPFMRMDPWLRNAHRQGYTLSVRGGGEALQYYLSGTLEANEGVLPRDQEDRQVLRTNFGFAPMPGLNVDWNTTLSRQVVQNTPMGNNPYSMALNAFRMPQGRPGNYIGSDDVGEVTKLLDYDIISSVDRVVTGVTATHMLGESLSNRVTLGLDRISSEMRNVRPFGYIGHPRGGISNEIWTNRNLTIDYVGTIELPIASDFRSRFSWGGQAVETEEISVAARADGLPGPGQHTVRSGAQNFGYEDRQRVINAGFFLQNLFDFRNRYFLTVGLRVDGNSAFGEGMGLQPYPRATASYVISDEPFWPERLGQLRLRAAWGHAGRAPGAFDAVRTWTPAPWIGQTAFLPGNVGNAELGPERTVEFETGFEAAVLQERVSITFSYYDQRTTDALFEVQQIPSMGFGGSQLANVGEISNRGLEIAVNTDVIRTFDWGWDVGLSAFTNRSKVVSLGGNPPFSTGGGWIEEGGPIPAIRNWGIRNPDELAEPILVRDSVFGPNQPTHTYQVSSSVRMPYGLVISGRGEYMGGHFIHDGANTGGISRGATSPFCDEIFPLIQAGQRAQFTARERSWCDPAVQHGNLVYPADFFRLRDMTLQIPVAAIIPGTSDATFSISAQNAWTWKNKQFLAMDPEMAGNSGMESGLARAITEHIPPPASLRASLRLTF